EPDQLAEPAVRVAQDRVGVVRQSADAPGELVGIEAAGPDPALVDLKNSMRHGRSSYRVRSDGHCFYISKSRVGGDLVQRKSKKSWGTGTGGIPSRATRSEPGRSKSLPQISGAEPANLGATDPGG